MIKEEQEEAAAREGDGENHGGIDLSTFQRICPVLLYNSELNGCEFPEETAKLEEWQSWAITILFCSFLELRIEKKNYSNFVFVFYSLSSLAFKKNGYSECFCQRL